MKKLTTLVLALALAASLAVPAFAANTTTLTTTVPAATYTLNIPADQEIPYGAISTNIGNVTVTDSASFAEGKNLEVTVKKDSFKSDTTNTTIAFTLSLVNTSDKVKYLQMPRRFCLRARQTGLSPKKLALLILAFLKAVRRKGMRIISL